MVAAWRRMDTVSKGELKKMNDPQTTKTNATGSSGEYDKLKAQKESILQKDLDRIRSAIFLEFRHYDETLSYEEETLP